MFQFDEDQAQVFALDPSRHARVLGAPGTGKTKLIVESVRKLVEEREWDPADILIISSNRITGANLRKSLESALSGVIPGTLVRTAPSFAFALNTRFNQIQGEDPPILMTGATQDDLLRQVLETADPELAVPSGLRQEVLHSQTFRTELRNFWSVLDDFDLSPRQLENLLSSTDHTARKDGAEGGVIEHHEQWKFATHLIDTAVTKSQNEMPAQLTAHGAMRLVSTLVSSTEIFGEEEIPKLVLVDDAAELTEGALGVLAAVVQRGSRVWFFGDPDIATSAFQGEGTRVLQNPSAEFERRGVRQSVHTPDDQTVILSRVYRHGPQLRELVTSITQKIGSSGVGQQRLASAAPVHAGSVEHEKPHSDVVQFTKVSSVSQQLGVVAHRLRSRHLGAEEGAHKTDWSNMAVLCRSNAEAQRAAAMLEHLQVPTMRGSGGTALRESRVVHDLIRILQHAFTFTELSGGEIGELLLGPLGGLDPISLRRLKSTTVLAERKTAFHNETTPRKAAESFEASLHNPEAIVDTREGRALRQLVKVIAAGTTTRQAGGTPREVLWSIWNTAHIAERLQQRALREDGQRSAEAHRSLDAALSLFFVLQRHEEQNSTTPLDSVLSELLESTVPQDTLAEKSERDAVTVTTPQGTIGQEFSVVCVLGPQEGSWPNMRSRGSILGTSALEGWLRGQPGDLAGRQETLHDELRLFAAACSRTRDELCVVALSNEDEFPSAFFRLGDAYEVASLPSARMTLRGKTAELRKRLTSNPSDAEAAQTLAMLAAQNIAGADPNQWYGMASSTTVQPLVDLKNDPTLRVNVSPSQIQSVEDCPLNWVVSRLSGGVSNTAANIGTLVHHALEKIRVPDLDRMRAFIDAEWSQLEFDAEWEAEKSRVVADSMLKGVTDYLLMFDATPASLSAAEATFSLEIDRAVLRGQADRVEMRTTAEGSLVPTVVDLKTGRNAPSRAEVEDHAQLLAYQLGLLEGVFTINRDSGSPEDDQKETHEFHATGGASLLFVHPEAQLKNTSFREFTQEPLTADQRQKFIDRVSAAAEQMAGAEFNARIEHHCTTTRFAQPCQIHIIPAVSHA